MAQSDFSNFTFEAEEFDVEKSLSSTTIDDNYNNFVNCSRQSELGFREGRNQKELDQNYKKLQTRIQELKRKEKKLRNKKETNPLYWCLIGAEYSDCCGIILKNISGDLGKLSPPKNIDEHQDLEAIKRKYRVIKAYDLLIILNDCFKRIYGKMNDFYNQHKTSRYHYTHLAPSLEGFESKAKIIEQYIELLKQFVSAMFEMKHRQ